MIKLYSGEAKPAGQATSVTGLGCRTAYNWDFPAKLEAAYVQGVDVWPLVQNAAGSVERFLEWRRTHQVSHVMLENEPFTQKRMGPVATADWMRSVPDTPGARRVLGGFLITYPETYLDIRGKVQLFVSAAYGLRPDDVMAFHPYLPSAPSLDEAPVVAAWFAAQIDMIASDWPLYAITEWGVPNGRVSYSGRDVPALAEYMRRGWDTMQAYGCYASAWYMAGPNAQFSEWCDSVLCMENGQPKPLGLVYRELGALEPEEPSSPEEPEAPEWETHNVATWIWGGRQYEATVRSRPL